MFSVLEYLLSKGGNNARALFSVWHSIIFFLYLNMVYFLTPHVSQPNWWPLSYFIYILGGNQNVCLFSSNHNNFADLKQDCNKAWYYADMHVRLQQLGQFTWSLSCTEFCPVRISRDLGSQQTCVVSWCYFEAASNSEGRICCFKWCYKFCPENILFALLLFVKSSFTFELLSAMFVLFLFHRLVSQDLWYRLSYFHQNKNYHQNKSYF